MSSQHRVPSGTPAGAGGADHAEQPRSGLRALVVEDEKPLADLVGSYLERDGFEVTIVHDGVMAVDAAREVDPDLIVLDLGLPGLDGVEVCRQVRTFSDAYVVMLTARTEEVETLIGLSVGADDYMTKPFSPRELSARVRAMLRRPRTATSGAGEYEAQLRTFGPLRIDPLGREVWLGDEAIQLTRTEFDLLATLSGRPRMAFSRQQLIDAVWGQTWVGDEHLVDVHIGHLRRKLGDDASRPRFVRTVRGVGYRMGTGHDH
jgi:DNA-binding response OmpR family regulator